MKLLQQTERWKPEGEGKLDNILILRFQAKSAVGQNSPLRANPKAAPAHFLRLAAQDLAIHGPEPQADRSRVREQGLGDFRAAPRRHERLDSERGPPLLHGDGVGEDVDGAGRLQGLEGRGHELRGHVVDIRLQEEEGVGGRIVGEQYEPEAVGPLPGIAGAGAEAGAEGPELSRGAPAAGQLGEEGGACRGDELVLEGALGEREARQELERCRRGQGEASVCPGSPAAADGDGTRVGRLDAEPHHSGGGADDGGDRGDRPNLVEVDPLGLRPVDLRLGAGEALERAPRDLLGPRGEGGPVDDLEDVGEVALGRFPLLRDLDEAGGDPSAGDPVDLHATCLDAEGGDGLPQALLGIAEVDQRAQDHVPTDAAEGIEQGVRHGLEASQGGGLARDPRGGVHLHGERPAEAPRAIFARPEGVGQAVRAVGQRGRAREKRQARLDAKPGRQRHGERDPSVSPDAGQAERLGVEPTQRLLLALREARPVEE